MVVYFDIINLVGNYMVDNKLKKIHMKNIHYKKSIWRIAIIKNPYEE
jgi:hypothetical protein